MSKPSITYTHVYESVRAMSHILTPPELRWDAEFVRRGQPSDYVIHLSCLAHFTPHLAYLAQQILARIGIEAPVIGGPESCCGTLAKHMGHPELEEEGARIGIAKFRRAKSRVVLSICPDCDETFNQFMADKRPFDAMNVADLFVRHEAQLVAHFKPVPMKVVMHAHFANDMRRRDMMVIERILRLIPGVELVPSTAAIATKTHCSVLFQMPPDAQEEMKIDVVRSGADALIVPYHSCYRQHCALETAGSFKVHHYLEVVAQAMGISFSEPYKELRSLSRWSDLISRISSGANHLGWPIDDLERMIEFSLFPYTTDKAMLSAMRSADST